MKDRRKQNPVIRSMLEHLAQEKTAPQATDLWPAVRAGLATGKPPFKHKELSMNKRIWLPAVSAALLLLVMLVYMARTATPVSARAILDRAYQAQSQAGTPAQGIRHTRTEMFYNPRALPEDQGIDNISEGYLDLQSNRMRQVTSDARTGRVVDVFAYDGANTYSLGHKEIPVSDSGVLTVYRSPQANISTFDRTGKGEYADPKEIFESMRQDPNAELLGQETWPDGRSVYVLRSRQPVKVLLERSGDGGKQDVKGEPQLPMGVVTAYFDTITYRMLGNRATFQKDGQDVLVNSFRELLDETLPAGTAVAWDLSDLQGITIVNDPNSKYGDLLPEVISPEQLAANTPAAYLLAQVPEGFALEITAPPQQQTGKDYIYIASYRNPAGDYFVIQAAPGKNPRDQSETYTTAAGLVLHFEKDYESPSGTHYTSAIVEAPDGTQFLLNSTLPRDTVKAWAEDLVNVK